MASLCSPYFLRQPSRTALQIAPSLLYSLKEKLKTSSPSPNTFSSAKNETLLLGSDSATLNFTFQNSGLLLHLLLGGSIRMGIAQ